MKQPLVLMILDGWGKAPASVHNAVTTARTPNLNAAFARYPHALLQCSGLAVGLPEGQMGNSEVGHTNLGAGRVVYQELTRISQSITDGSFFRNDALTAAIAHAKATRGTIHLMGLLSDGGVHSHMEHLLALLRLCVGCGVPVRIHCFLDGRDTPPASGAAYLRQLEAVLATLPGDFDIATLAGRFYAMDRDRRWDRLERAYRALVCEDAPLWNRLPSQAAEAAYARGVTDEFLEPVSCVPGCAIRPGDSVIFYNFRPDRARELTRALCDDDFDGFARPGGAVKPYFVCFTQYDAAMPNVRVAFAPEGLRNIFGEYISEKGLTQLRIAETEKYAHVTFFFNGGEERVFPGEDRALIPSPKVATYDLQPEMHAALVTEECIRRLRTGAYDVVVLNFANCDMVGHTGVMDAAVKAVETVDTCVGQLLTVIGQLGGTALITADHGNADCMEQNSIPFTAHTTNPVPVILCREGVTLRDGALCDVAPTLLELLGLPQPKEMTGHSLICK